MKKKLFVLLLVNVLLLSTFSGLKGEVNAQEQYLSNEFDITEFSVEDESAGIIDIKITEDPEKIITESYINNENNGKTILYKSEGKLEEFDEEGNISTSYIEDYVDDIESIKDLEGNIEQEFNQINQSEDMIMNSKNLSTSAKKYTVPKGYKKTTSLYSKPWKATGTLYQKKKTTYGKEYVFNFSKGTKITTVYAVISGIAKKHVLTALGALGVSVVGTVIDGVARGKLKTRYKRTDSVVVVKSRLGLKTYKTVVDSYIYNEKNGKVSTKRQRVEGDTRSNSNLIHAGIYNVVALGM